MATMVLPEDYISMDSKEISYTGGSDDGIGCTQFGTAGAGTSAYLFSQSYREYRQAVEQQRGGMYQDVVDAVDVRIPAQKVFMACSAVMAILSIGTAVYGITELADS